jgi:xylan 1,4-beta-xylosidase
MLGLLGGERIEAKSSAAFATEQVIDTGVREAPEVRAIATRSSHAIQVLVWNYHDDDIPATHASINAEISGLPESVKRTSVEHFRIDSAHSNAFTIWKEMGSPLSPTPEQYARLESAGQLQLVTSPQWMQIDRGTLHLQFELPRQGLSLLKIQW